MTRLLGVDLGERRIGIAVGDTDTGTVRPLATLRRRDLDEDARALGRIAAEQAADGLVVGLPLNLDGTEGPQAMATREWGDAVAASLGMALTWSDERLSSELAESRLGRLGRGRSGGPPSGARRSRYRAAVDREAARVLLQRALDTGALEEIAR